MPESLLDILSTLQSGQNPTPSVNSTKGMDSGTGTSNFGLQSVNEGYGPDSESGQTPTKKTS